MTPWLSALAPLLVAFSDTPFFTNVADPIVTDAGGRAKGAAWGDVNGDGRLDLIWMNTNASVPSRLALQQPDHSFVISDQPWLVAGENEGMPVLGDVDNDGDLDLWFGNWNSPVHLVLNHGALDFEPIEISAQGHRSRGTALADYDGDGLLDAYVSTQATSGIGEDKLYRGAGTTMTDVTPPVQFADQDRGRGVVWADFDDDGDLDLYQAHGNGCPCEWEVMPEDWIDAARNRMWRNDGNGVFTDVTTAVTGDTNNGRGVAVGDFDNDGDLDLAIANLAITGDIEGPKNIGAFGGANRLLRNDGDFQFTDVTPAALAIDTQHHRSCALIDVDLDGDLDVNFVGVNATWTTLHLNNGDVTWSYATPAAFLGITNGRANPWGDYDRDGDLDLFLTFSSGNRLLRNDQATSNHWLIVELTGTRSNRSAVGARVTVEATIDGAPRAQIREVITGSGYWSQHQLAPHFGVGDATIIERVTVRWPSGTIDVIENVAVDQYLALTESAPPPCAGDADGDRIVGFTDVVTILEAWGPCPGCPGDLDGDDMQGLSDLLIVLSAWGPCP